MGCLRRTNTCPRPICIDLQRSNDRGHGVQHEQRDLETTLFFVLAVVVEERSESIRREPMGG